MAINIASTEEVLAEETQTPNKVDERIKATKALKRLINLRFLERQIKQEIEALHEEALQEFKEIFNGERKVNGNKVKLHVSYGPTTWKFSEKVERLKKELRKLQQKEKMDGTAKAIPSDKEILKVEIKTDNLEES